jgi:hypothetical protein
MSNDGATSMAWASGQVFGPPIRRIFRDVIADRLASSLPPLAAMLFTGLADPSWEDDRSFVSDFYSEILHQDTCGPGTAEAVPLVAALAADERVGGAARAGGRGTGCGPAAVR